MGLTEIILLLVGAVIFTISFFLPDVKGSTTEETKELAREEVKEMILTEMNGIKGQVEDVVEEAAGYAVEKTERSLERLTNEKMMAINEYSDTVLQEIHKNHEEALFLYDMLNSKHINLKDTVSKVNQTVKAAEETTKEMEATVSSFQGFSAELETERKTETEDKTKSRTEASSETETEAELETERKTETEVRTGSETESGIKQEPVNMDISFASGNDGVGQNSNDRILELHKQGKSKVAIAKELGLGVGEVKLVIDLYKNM